MRPIDELLSEMMARTASDLHIKAGSPPVIRVDGELALLDEPPLTPEDTKDVAASIMTDKQIRRFSEHNDIDFAYSSSSLGRCPSPGRPLFLSRFHSNTLTESDARRPMMVISRARRAPSRRPQQQSPVDESTMHKAAVSTSRVTLRCRQRRRPPTALLLRC